ncbi:MAG: hypothetical protein J5I50_10455 [Chitinophagaceae bacterium]|nr:hypothetical protein [Chitinophagaceae bacterium]
MTDIAITPGKNATFDIYRYQLLVDKAVQLRTDSPYQNPDEVRAAKNTILENILSNQNFHFKSNKSEIESKLVYQKNNRFYFKVAVKRQKRITNKDFTETTVEDYPNILIAFNNAPDVQKIAIQSYTQAFKETDTVSRILEETIDKQLRNESLSFYLEPIFDKREFWKMVSHYDKKIKQLSFEMVSPNMANISRNLQINLKELYEDTNSHKTTVELNSDGDSNLEINPDSKLINSLVDYTSEGGGNISMRVEGIRKKLHTAQSKAEFSVEEALLKGMDWDALDEKFKDILI